MIRKIASGTAIIVAVAVTVVAQGVLAQLGQTEASAREHAIGLFADQGMSNSALGDRPLVLQARKGFLTLAPTARAQAMTGLYAWMKTYVNSAEFKAAYRKLRDERNAGMRDGRGTVDEELKKQLAGQRAEAEQTAREMTTAGQKAQADAYLKSVLQQLQNPMTLQAMRMEIEETRARQSKDDAYASKDWELHYPPDPMTLVARELRAFLEGTTDIDFAAKRHTVQGEGGSVVQFVNPAYEAKPWQWRFSYEFGPEAIAAARASAAAWLKELGQ